MDLNLLKKWAAVNFRRKTASEITDIRQPASVVMLGAAITDTLPGVRQLETHQTAKA